MARPVSVADAALPGWVFGHANAMEWQPIGDRIALKALGHTDGKVIAMFKWDPGYAGRALPYCANHQALLPKSFHYRIWA